MLLVWNNDRIALVLSYLNGVERITNGLMVQTPYNSLVSQFFSGAQSLTEFRMRSLPAVDSSRRNFKGLGQVLVSCAVQAEIGRPLTVFWFIIGRLPASWLCFCHRSAQLRHSAAQPLEYLGRSVLCRRNWAVQQVLRPCAVRETRATGSAIQHVGKFRP